MSRRRRLLLLIVFEAVLLGLTVVTGRLWVGESWRQVIEMCVFFLLTLIGCEAARRRRERRASAPPR
jgi:hypothetical protein